MANDVLGLELIDELFPYIITDNESGFSNPCAIEYRDSYKGGRSLYRANIFYCDADCTYQKVPVRLIMNSSEESFQKKPVWMN